MPPPGSEGHRGPVRPSCSREVPVWWHRQPQMAPEPLTALLTLQTRGAWRRMTQGNTGGTGCQRRCRGAVPTWLCHHRSLARVRTEAGLPAALSAQRGRAWGGRGRPKTTHAAPQLHVTTATSEPVCPLLSTGPPSVWVLLPSTPMEVKARCRQVCFLPYFKEEKTSPLSLRALGRCSPASPPGKAVLVSCGSTASPPAPGHHRRPSEGRLSQREPCAGP